MDQIKKLQVELLEVQKEIKKLYDDYSRSTKQNHYFSNYVIPEQNKLYKKKKSIQNKINQLRFKYWYWD